MQDNHRILKSNIDNLSKESKSYIIKEGLWDGEILYLLDKKYPKLHIEIGIHEKVRMAESLMKKIVSGMKSNESLKSFLCVNIQEFAELFESENYNNFKNFFYGKILEKPKERKLREKIKGWRRIGFDDIEDFKSKEIKLKGIKRFGFYNWNLSKRENISLEEDGDETIFIKLLTIYFRKKLEWLNGRKALFRRDLVVPMKKIMEILPIAQSALYIEESYVLLDPKKIQTPEVQNFFASFQFHHFFEEYVNGLFHVSGKVISNPIIIFNPSEKNGRIEGYFELDGSICLTKDKKILLIECKNSKTIQPKYLTHFLGKSLLIENTYKIKSKKYLFSTGKRYPMFDNIERFGYDNDINIYCIKDFLNNFSRMK